MGFLITLLAMVFKKYGFIGLILIVLAQVNLILKIQPFEKYYFPIIWIGYILVIDAIVFKLQNKSKIPKTKFQTVSGFEFGISNFGICLDFWILCLGFTF